MNVKVSVAVLEIGCSVGGISFQLSDVAKSVLGIDHSSSEISIAEKLAAGGTITCELGSSKPIEISKGQRKNLHFRCADAMCLPAELKCFDVVVVSDVIDKLAAPNSLFGRLGKFGNSSSLELL